MRKPITVLLLLAAALCLSAQTGTLSEMIDNLLALNPDYQQLRNRFDREKSVLAIDKSIQRFEINYLFRRYDNEFTRKETDDNLEFSNVEEDLEHHQVELGRELFPKNFDNVTDLVGARINLLRYEQSVKLGYSTGVGDIFDEMMDWYRADSMISLLHKNLDTLLRQNLLLEEMYQNKEIDPDILIANIEEIGEIEADLHLYKQVMSTLSHKYGSVLTDFVQRANAYLETNAEPDTLLFLNRTEIEIKNLERDVRRLSNRLKLVNAYFFLPEISLSLSLNWRETKQIWDIEQGNLFRQMIRIQKEKYPQGQIELSLPLDLYSNTAGKLGLMKALKSDLQARSAELGYAWRKLSADILVSYSAAKHDLLRKKRLSELYAHNLELQQIKYGEEPSLLGGVPELKLQRDTRRAQETLIERKIAELELCKQVFLIQKLGEDLK